jgi:CRP/FNR family transcriptional regulator, cyclic AMP receptor protein
MLLSVSRSTVTRTNVVRRDFPSTAPSAPPKLCRHGRVHCCETASQPSESIAADAFPLIPELPESREAAASSARAGDAVDPLYLFARFLAWEESEEPSAAWDVLEAGRSSDADTRAQALALLASSHHFAGASSLAGARRSARADAPCCAESDMSISCGLEINEKCAECKNAEHDFFCNFSGATLDAWDGVTHKSTLPAGAILFVEGQAPRGMFVICSGRVNLSTTSKEGKLLLLKTADAGEVVGLSATISGLGYEVTAETATAAQVSFIDRNHVLELMQTHGEFGMQSARFLSRGFHEAYRDIRDLMLSKTSAGKLARLLLSQSPVPEPEGPEVRIPSAMTHEEMAHRIGASRETVTRLLTDLKKRHLIRSDGPALVIRNRTALEALTT